MTSTLTLRRAKPADLAAVDALLARSYPRLLAKDYPPSVMVTAIPIITRARPELLASPHYFVAEDAQQRIVGAGGWSMASPGGMSVAGTGHVRHVATDPDRVRQGVGRALMAHVMQDARGAGVRWLECLSTLTAVPFYAALGFRTVQPLALSLTPGIPFAVMRMLADLSPDGVAQ